MYDYERAHEILEDRSTLKVTRIPRNTNRSSPERNRRTKLPQHA
jgi:hypothetical protein